jgi:glycosyltransferase involved in cell wall biosynthesis
MKVLHVITSLSDGGGAEKLMEDVLPMIKAKGLDVSIAVLNDMDTNNKKNLKAKGINVIKIGSGEKIYSLLKMLKLVPIMKDFDIVHSHLTAPFFFCAFGSLFSKVKLVTTIHNTDMRYRRFASLRKLERWAISRYETIIACSNEVEASLRNVLGKNLNNLMTISNGVKLDKFFQAIPSPLFKDKRWRLITMVAMFRPEKDHKTVICALKNLPKSYHLILVGYGELMEEVKQFAKDSGVEERTHFLGKRTDVPNILKASDFIVLSSHHEGLSLASIEGMAAGKPFIASDVPGLRELVKGYGILFDEGNSEQLASIIMRLDNNSMEYSQVADQCRDRASAYDLSKMVEGYLCVYNQIEREAQM